MIIAITSAAINRGNSIPVEARLGKILAMEGTIRAPIPGTPVLDKPINKAVPA